MTPHGSIPAAKADADNGITLSPQDKWKRVDAYARASKTFTDWFTNNWAGSGLRAPRPLVEALDYARWCLPENLKGVIQP